MSLSHGEERFSERWVWDPDLIDRNALQVMTTQRYLMRLVPLASRRVVAVGDLIARLCGPRLALRREACTAGASADKVAGGRTLSGLSGARRPLRRGMLLALLLSAQPTFGEVVFSGLFHAAQGGALLTQLAGRLTVSNLGSSGMDGVSIALPNAAGWEAHWQPLDPTGALPVGAFIQSQALGTAGTPTAGLLGSWKVTKKGTGNYIVTADFSPLGCSTVTLQVFNGPTLVTTLTGQSGALASVNGCVDDDHWGNPTPSGPNGLPGPFGGALTFLDTRTFSFSGSASVQGDRLVILPEGGAAVSSLTQTTVLASGIPQISIDAERHFVQYAGLLQGALGQAALHVAGGQLTVSNLGSSGQDGVEIELAAPSQRKLNLYYQVPADDGSLSITGLGTAGGLVDQPVGNTRIEFSGSTKTVSFDYSSIGASTYTLRIYNGRQLVHESHGHPSGPCVMQDRFKYKKIALDDVHMGWWEEGPDEWNGTFWIPTSTWHDGYTCDTSQETSTQRVIGGPTVLGNLVLAIPENPTLTVGAVSRTRIEASGQIASLQFAAESLSGARSTASALGQATFVPDGSNLTVNNLGSSGQDGVSIALPDTSAWDGHWQPLETTAAPLPVDAYVQSQVFGNAGSIADGLLGSWRLTKKGTGNYVVTADYSPLGSATVTVQVYNGMTLVATRTGQSGQLGTISGCVEDDHHGNPVPTRPFGPFGGALTMFGPLDMKLADNTTVTGDRFVILPEGAAVVDSLTRVNVQTSGVAQLVLTSESVQPTVGALHNAALDYLRAHGLWLGGVTRYTSANVTQVSTSIGDYLKSVGFDSAETDAATSAVLQNLTQANLIFSAGGVTCFGAPVTSDQFVPYLMARLQTGGAVSAAFVARVNSVNDMIVSRADSAAVLSYVVSSFPGTFTSAADNHAAELFVDTYVKSYAYWNDPTHQGGSGGGTASLAPGDGVIIADAAGALYGLLLGPIGSIVYGAAFSVIANNASIAQPSGSTGYNGLNHVALGTGTLDVKLNRLIVSNIGSSGQDGISIPMPKMASWAAHWQPLDPTGALPVGAYIQSEVFGTTGPPASGLLGSWRVTKKGTDNYQVTADFSPLGSSTVTLQVFNGTTLVTTLTGQSGALANMNGCVDDDHWGNPTPSGPYGFPGRFGGALTFLGPLTFTFAGGATAQGDRLAILPEGGAAVSSLSQACVLASGIPQISIDAEEMVLQNPGYSDWAAAAAAAAGLTPAQLGGPLDDFNHSGFSNLLKYAFGISPVAPSVGPVITQAIASLTVGTTTDEYFTLSCEHPANPAAAPVAQTSDDLQSWTPAVLVSSVPQANGLLLDTWRTPLPRHAKPTAALRFQVTLTE